jgi:hypothetical protein
MARIRSVHPGIWTDEKFVMLGVAARVLLIGIWTEADDRGVFEWKPVVLKMRIFPADNIDVAPLLDELAQANVLRRFSVDDREYGAVRNFCKYQKPKKPAYKYPLAPELAAYVAVPGESSSPPVPHQFPTGTEIGSLMEEGGGKREREKKDAAAPLTEPAAPPSAASPAPAGPPLRAAPVDDGGDAALFERGKQVLGKNAGGLIKQLKAAKDGNIALARAAIEQASTKQNAREYIGAVVRKRDPPAGEAVRYVDPRL